MTKIDGRKAVVTNGGRCYSTYAAFAAKHGYLDAALPSSFDPKDGDRVTLLVSGKHDSHRSAAPIWIVENAQGMRALIGEDGLDIEKLTVIDGKQYREVRRKADVGELVKCTENCAQDGVYYRPGDVGRYIKPNTEGYPSVEVDFTEGIGGPSRNGRGNVCFVGNGCYVVLEPVVTAPASDIHAQLDGLTQTVASLTLRVTELERKYGPPSVTDVARQLSREIAERKPRTRDVIVEMAKKDVAELERRAREDSSFGHEFPAIDEHGRLSVKFVVNRDKRTVVAIGSYYYVGDTVAVRGKARCAPDDCFNVHIGRAIALRRALGLTVPDEYITVPQPEGVRVGDVVDTYDGDRKFHMRITVRGVETDSDGEIQLDHAGCDRKGYTYTSFDVEYGDHIIDDSRTEATV